MQNSLEGENILHTVRGTERKSQTPNACAMSNDPASTEMFKPFEADKDVKSMTSEPRDNLEEFDPFEIGAPASVSKKGSSVKSGQRTVSSGGSAASKSSSALPPRIDIKFKVHEEISSTADTSDANEGSSSIYVEGIVMVRKIHIPRVLDVKKCS